MDIRHLCRELRKNQTKGEEIFWDHVRNRKFWGLKFTRQYPIFFEIDGKKRFFIADFYCFEKRIIIEIDGKIHEKQIDYDELRDFLLNELGYKVIRIKNDDIFKNITEVLNRLRDSPPRSPSLLREGDGNNESGYDMI